MLTKEKIIQLVNDLPNKFSLEDVLDRIALLEKIEVGSEQSQAEQPHSTEVANQKMHH